MDGPKPDVGDTGYHNDLESEPHDKLVILADTRWHRVKTGPGPLPNEHCVGRKTGGEVSA